MAQTSQHLAHHAGLNGIVGRGDLIEAKLGDRRRDVGRPHVY
jgi:hypothetical protein